MNKSQLLTQFDLDLPRTIEELKEFLSFPSISTDASHNGDCRTCADWLVRHLSAMGLKAELLETPAKPVVYAEHRGKKGKTTVLFYGHYDVQPPDPLEDWTSPPFEPAIRDGRIYARGAHDNKGQVFYFLKGVEELLRMKGLDITLKILIEGEEESGCGGISAGLPQWKERLKADILMVDDTAMVDADTPTLVLGLRGIAGMTVTLSGPLRDLHSGDHGGKAPNPATQMARLLAVLHNPDGSIAVPGFYDAVVPPTPTERELADSAPWNDAEYQRVTGVRAVSGERQFSPAIRNGFRPSIDINGLHSGYGGPGMKTIIPARATAKLSTRLVPDQDPESCLTAIEAYLRKHAPEGLSLEISERYAAGRGFRLQPDSALVKKAQAVLHEVADKAPAFCWEGASIPIVAELAAVSGAEPLLCGFGSEEDCIHAPNESLRIDHFRMGWLYTVLMLDSLQSNGSYPVA